MAALVVLFALLLSGGYGRAGASIALSDLDVTQVQGPEGPLTELDQSRTEDGIVLAPGQSFWVDLKRDAESLTATVQAMPRSRGAPVRCRFATATYIWDVTVREDGGPIPVSIPLKGDPLLVVEVSPSESGGKTGVNVHISSSSIVSNTQRPQAWGGAGPIEFRSQTWRVKIDGRTGGLTEIVHPQDRLGMQWLRPASSWGTGWATVKGARHEWQRPSRLRALGPHSAESVYESGPLSVSVQRQLDVAADVLRETYVFQNRGKESLSFAEGDLGIRITPFDSYPGADICLTQRCHVHLWTGGASSFLNALRMGGSAPHLGMVLDQGSLTGYSITDRVQHSNDRGQFVLHPPALVLNPGEHYAIAWTVFWHRGGEDFWQKTRQSPQFVRLSADRYTVEPRETIKVHAESAQSLQGARLRVNGAAWPARVQDGRLEASIPASEAGEEMVTLELKGAVSHLRAFVSPPPLELIKKRVRFILRHQQRSAPGDPLDGAYLVFDNEKQTQIYDAGFADHNAGRERVGMGVLAALYLPHCDEPGLKTEIEASLRRYAAFVDRELQNPRGDVFNDARRAGPVRMYNFPWVVQFHLAVHQAFGDPGRLRRAVETTRMYYARRGEKFYCIGMPVLNLLEALQREGWHNERKEMLALFRKHADAIVAIGTAYPKHEVNFEQSIVGPAAQILLEVYLATREAKYLDGAREQLRLLELFNGQQPDYHQHEIAIRHWDGYWFGGRKQYGDTFPHYWSTITGRVFALYAQASGQTDYQRRARENLMNNLCAFTPEGRGSAAFLYPLSINGAAGRFFDPWANDQDWALVAWLQLLGPGR